MLYEEQLAPGCAARTAPVCYCQDVENKVPDKQLWEAFKKGSEYAFTVIYYNYSTLLYEYGCRYTTDKELVRDCLHDFFVYLKENRQGFSTTTSIKYYLLKSFKRRIIDYQKKERNILKVTDQFEMADFEPELRSEATYLTRQANKELMERLGKALTALDGIEQKAIYYFYFKGMGYDQIAQRFNFSHVSSARRVMYRSLKQLRTFFVNA